MGKTNYVFTEEKDKYNFFTIDDIINFMDENNRCPYTWSGVEFDVRFNIPYKEAKLSSFYDEKNNTLNKVRIFAHTKLGNQPIPCYIFVNDFTFKVVSCREYRGDYREDRTFDMSNEWRIDRLVERGDEYKTALIKETEDKRMKIRDEIVKKVESLEQEIQNIQNAGDDRMEEEERLLGKIFDGATRKIYAPGSAARKVLNKNKSLEESNKDLINALYGEGYYENVLGENRTQVKEVKGESNTQVKNNDKQEKATHIVFGYDHDEVTGRGK